VIAAVGLAGANAAASTPTARKRAASAAMKQVALYLGDTPTVTRASYTDPRLVDLFNDGITISPALASRDADLPDGVTHGRIEKAVLALWPRRRARRASDSRRTGEHSPRRGCLDTVTAIQPPTRGEPP